MEFKTNKDIIFECVAGSHAYGTNIETSDIDLRGIFLTPKSEHISLNKTEEQIGDEKNDITFYELKRYFQLAMNANPNVLELLWMPPDCVRKCKDPMKILLNNRDLFISQKARHSFSGYAYAQIKRAKGQNKWVNNPQPEERPSKLDFCWYIPLFTSAMEMAWDGNYDLGGPFPMRPVPLSEAGIDLAEHHAAKLEHAENTYRLYETDGAKGVFRGPSMQLVVESISKKEEFTNLRGLLIFNEQAYEAACKDWKNYWTWVKNRNKARWVTQERGEIDYDTKNIAHCMRLLISGIHIMEHGFPLVRFEGEQREFLMAIRRGEFEYEDIMKKVNEYKAELERSVENTKIPYAVDDDALNDVYRKIMNTYG